MIKWLLIGLALLLSGCCTFKKCRDKYPYEIEYKETIVYRDSIITVEIQGEAKTDSVFIDVEIPVNIAPFRLQTEFCRSVAWVQNNQLKMDLVQHHVEKEIEIQFVDRIIEKSVIVEVNRLTRWQEFKGYLGLLFLIMLVVWLVVKLL